MALRSQHLRTVAVELDDGKALHSLHVVGVQLQDALESSPGLLPVAFAVVAVTNAEAQLRRSVWVAEQRTFVAAYATLGSGSHAVTR